MKSFKFQTPSTREISNLKLQIPSGGYRHGGFKKPRNCSSRRKEAHFEKKEWIRASLRRLLHILESALGHRFGVWSFLILALSASCFASEPTPLVQAHAHNDYLEVAAETGWAGAALLFVPIAVLFVRMVVSFLDDPRQYRRAVTLGCIGSILAMLVHSLIDFNLHIPANALIFACVLGIGYKASCLERREDRKGSGRFVA